MCCNSHSEESHVTNKKLKCQEKERRSFPFDMRWHLNWSKFNSSKVILVYEIMWIIKIVTAPGKWESGFLCERLNDTFTDKITQKCNFWEILCNRHNLNGKINVCMLGIMFDIMFFLNLKLFLKHRFYLIIGTK